MHLMENTWITLWLLYFYHEYIKWEMAGLPYGYCTFTINALNGKCLDLHYGYCTFTMNALNGKCLDYVMVTVLLP